MKQNLLKLKVKLAVLMVISLSVAYLSGCVSQEGISSATETEMIRIGIIQFATHPSLDATREGFLDVLKANGYEEGKQLDVVIKNGEGDQPTIRSIAQQFAEDEFNLILAIATPAAQAMANVTDETPILITAVTDPVGAKLVESMDKPNTNVTGTSDYVSISTQLELATAIVPEIETLGVIYNSGEENSLVQVDEVKRYAEDNQLTVIEATPTNSSEVLQAAQSLIGRVDAIYVPTDNTVVSAFEGVVKVCHEENIPLFPGEGDSVARGGLATAGVDYYKLGEKTGKQALKIIQGESPANIPVETQDEVSVIVNLKVAELVNVDVPQEILDKAVEIITE